MRTAIDSNVIVALWSIEPTASRMTALLRGARDGLHRSRQRAVALIAAVVEAGANALGLEARGLEVARHAPRQVGQVTARGGAHVVGDTFQDAPHHADTFEADQLADLGLLGHAGEPVLRRLAAAFGPTTRR